MKEIIVSVITPSYNQGEFIEETIKSVISQEGDFYLEYLIMDGGSTDETLGIITKYERLIKEGKWPLKCKGITYAWVSEPDKGQSDAINKGFRMAKGEIVAWLNSDDTYEPGAVSAAVDHFLSHPDTAMVYGNGNEIDENGEVIAPFANNRDFDLDVLINVFDYILQPTVFMRKEALDYVGGLKTELRWCMDWDLWIRLGKRFKVDFITQSLANSRIHGSTKTSTGGLRRFKELVSLLREHSNKRFPPGYFLYGYEFFNSTIEKKAPQSYRFFLKYLIWIFGITMYTFYLNKKIYKQIP